MSKVTRPAGLRARPILAFALASLAGVELARPQNPDAISAPGTAAAGAPRLTRSTNPPLMLPIEKGFAYVGTKTERIKKFLENRGSRFKGDLASQNPGQRIRVEGFWMSLCEVTNRQYLEFTKDSGHIVPFHWCKKDLDAARSKHEAAEEARRKQLLAKGEAFKEIPFDPVTCWLNHWKEFDWSIPAGQEDFPVTHIRYGDALAYCLWAGLRLPTEAEWVRAAHGDKDIDYPWGDKWKTEDCLNIDNSGMRLRPIASFSQVKSPFGILDLAGSVYEWTTSPFLQLPGYTPLYPPAKRGERKAIDPKFNASKKVLKGGSFGVNDPKFATRVAHRQKAFPNACSPQVGFRPVHSMIPGKDHIDNLLTHVVLRELIDGKILTERTLGEEYWMVELCGSVPAVPAYGIIKSHEGTLFAPVSELRQLSIPKLHEASLKLPITLGLFHISQDLTSPPLKAGTYILKYRGAGKPEKKDVAEKKDAPKAGGKKTKKDTKKKRPKRLSRREKKKLEEAKKKQEAEAKKKAAEEAKKKEEEAAAKRAKVAAGEAPSLQEKPKQDEESALKPAIEIDPTKENLLFYDAASGRLIQAIASVENPFKIYKGRAGKETVSTFGEVEVEKGRDRRGKKIMETVRRFAITFPTSSSRTFFKLNLDINK